MKAVGILRNRGQLTIPDKIRQSVYWLNQNSAIVFTVTNQQKIFIEPHQPLKNLQFIMSLVKKSRSIHGKSSVSGTEFLQQDRKMH